MLTTKLLAGTALAITMSLGNPVATAADNGPNTITNGDQDHAGQGSTKHRRKEGELPRAEDLVAYWPCASAEYRPGNPHFFSFSLYKKNGWKNMAKKRMIPAIEELGFKRLAFHLPLGKDSHNDGHMGIDAPDDLAESGDEWAVDQCLKWFDWVHKKHPDVEIIVYLGSHDRDQDEDLDNGEYWEHFDRMWRGVQPFIDRDYISIIFDNAVVWDEDEPYARVVQLAKYYKDRQGRLVGVEASPQKARDWTRDYAVMLNESTWQKQRHSTNIPLNLLKGEIISIIDGHSKKLWRSDYNNDPMEMATALALEGRTPAIQVWCEFENMTATEIVDEIAARADAGSSLVDGSDDDDGTN